MSERHLVDRLVGEDRVARAGPAGSKREERKKGGVQGERERESVHCEEKKVVVSKLI